MHFFPKTSRIAAPTKQTKHLGSAESDRAVAATLDRVNAVAVRKARSSSIQNHGAIERRALRFR
jgi:hypothetical protein